MRTNDFSRPHGPNLATHTLRELTGIIALHLATCSYRPPDRQEHQQHDGSRRYERQHYESHERGAGNQEAVQPSGADGCPTTQPSASGHGKIRIGGQLGPAMRS